MFHYQADGKAGVFRHTVAYITKKHDVFGVDAYGGAGADGLRDGKSHASPGKVTDGASAVGGAAIQPGDSNRAVNFEAHF